MLKVLKALDIKMPKRFTPTVQQLSSVQKHVS